MKCSYCGAEAPANAKFCRCCGTRLAPGRQPAEPVQPPVPQAPAVTAPTAVPDIPAPAFDIPPFHWQEAPAAACAPEPPVLPSPSPAPAAAPVSCTVPVRTAPRIQLPTGRSLAKMFFLGILTAGIYPAVIWSRIVTELNITASRHDGERTVPWLGMLPLSLLTLMIYNLVWHHGLCRRIGSELRRRGLSYTFGPSDFWLWNILGCLILVGPFIFIHRLMKAMNFLNRDFNTAG